MAPMCAATRGITIVLLLIPLGLVLAWIGLGGNQVLCWAGLSLPVLYAGVWLWSRPREFVVGAEGVEIRWPVRRQRLTWNQIVSARLAPSGRELRSELGVAVRVGVGGLWGVFGWIWSLRKGWCPVYVSRAHDLVWIERSSGAPYLLSPEHPEAFVAAVQAQTVSAGPGPGTE